MRAALRSRRGVALLVVLVALTLMTTIVMEFYFSARVKLALAVNARDEVKAYFNARSGINLMRLALKFQYELQSEGGIIGQAVDRSNFQLWQYLQLLLPTFVSARVESPVGSLDLQETGAMGFGEVEGDIIFHDPEPEEGKINLNAFSGYVIDQEALIQLCSLFAPEQYDPLFGDTEEGSFAEMPTRGEVIGAIIDYVDADSDLVVVNDACEIEIQGAGAESRRFVELDYESKNEPFTTLDEVLLVPGVTVILLDTFRANLTVYAIADQFFVNLADAQSFMGFLCANVNIYGSAGAVNACRSPQIAVQVALLSLALEGWNAFFANPYNMLSFYLGMSTGAPQMRVAEGIAAGQMIGFRTERDFFTVLDLFINSPETLTQYAMLADPQRAVLFGLMASGGQAVTAPRIDVDFNREVMAGRISVSTPRVFTVSATGIYGTASRTITTVADYSQDGRLLYWREY